MRQKLPAILTLLGVCFAVSVVSATDVANPGAEGVSAPYLIAGSRVTPSYPPAAYAAKTSGIVKIRATVNANGTVGAIEILESSSRNMGFEQAALAAVNQWKFEPARSSNGAVESHTDIRLSFNPPSSGSRGYVSSSFGGGSAPAITASMAGMPMRGAMAGQMPRDKGDFRAAWLPIEMKRIEKYGRPPGQLGAIYDRRDLIPPGTGGHHQPRPN